MRIGEGSAVGAGSVLFRGGAMGQKSRGLEEVASGGGPLWRRTPVGAVRAGLCGRRDVELEGAGTEMSATADCPERDSAGLAGGGKLGWGSGPGMAAGPALEWAGPAVWRVDARGKDQGPGPAEAGTLGLKFCGDISYF